MSNATITFPMLGDGFSVCPSNHFVLFGHTFYWYGVIIAVGFLLAIMFCLRRAPRYGLKGDDYIDALIAAVPVGIVGARLYFVVFNFADYKDNLIDVVKIWEGGLAIYGGIIFGALAMFLVARHKKKPFGAFLDVTAFGLFIGQAIGRWGNFMNREAFGGETDIFCRMGLTLNGVTTYVHPTFLYESLWNVLGFVLLLLWSKKDRRRFDGHAFLLYAGWYGLGRMFIEGLRTDSLYIGSLRVSQVLAAASLLAVIAALLIERFTRKKDPQRLYVNRAKPAEDEVPVDKPGDTL